MNRPTISGRWPLTWPCSGGTTQCPRCQRWRRTLGKEMGSCMIPFMVSGTPMPMGDTITSSSPNARNPRSLSLEIAGRHRSKINNQFYIFYLCLVVQHIYINLQQKGSKNCNRLKQKRCKE